MYLCNPCLQAHFYNHESLAKSDGKCEYCGKLAICNDIPSKQLQERAKYQTDMNGNTIMGADGRPLLAKRLGGK